MLSTKLFTIKTFLLQEIIYFGHNNLVKADGEALVNELSVTDINLLCFSALVKEKVCRKSSPIECFPPSGGDDDYVPLASFKDLKMDIKLLKRKLSTATLVILTWTENFAGNADQRTSIGNRSLKFKFSKDSENRDNFQICLKKMDFDTIFQYANTDRFEIKVLLVTPAGKTMCLVTITNGEAAKLNIYWPFISPIPPYEQDMQQNFTPYFKCFESICMDTIELFKNEIGKKSMNISKNEDEICLHLDKYPTAILYYTEMEHFFKFKNNFKIQLESLPKENYDIPEVADFKCRPSMLIRFNKINNTNQDCLEFQILEYKYNNKMKSYSWLDNDNPITHATINFNSKPNISPKSNEIPFFIRIDPLRKTSQKIPYKIMMYFNTTKLNYKDEGYKNLEKLINKVTISINSIESDEIITLDKKYLEIKKTNNRFTIEINLTQLKEDDINLLKPILEKRSGVFIINVLNNDQIIIESLVCLSDTKLAVVSTNELRECLKKYTQPKNKKKVLSSENNNSDEDSSDDKLLQGLDLESSLSVKTPHDDKSNAPPANPPQGPPGVSPGGTLDTTKDPNANPPQGPPGVSPGGTSDTTKDPNAHPPQGPPVVSSGGTSDTTKDPNGNPPQGPPRVSTGGTSNTIKDPNGNPPQGPPGVSAGGDSGNQGLNQFTSNGEWVQRISEVGESIPTSGNGVQDVNDFNLNKNQVSFLNDNQDGNTIDNGGSKEPDNTNPKTKVKGTTPDDSAKNTTKSKSENTATDSEDKPEKEEEKSGNKTIIIILIVVAVAVVCGLIGYTFFS